VAKKISQLQQNFHHTTPPFSQHLRHVAAPHHGLSRGKKTAKSNTIFMVY
jgi:hypothetical protein